MKFAHWSALALLAAPALAPAASYNWPDVAPPCSAAVTLQQCLDAVNANDTVNVISNSVGTVGQYLTVNKPLTLRAAPGYRPVLPAGTGISVSASPGVGVNWSSSIEGFTLLDGAVSVQVGSGNASVSLRHLDVTSLNQSGAVGSGLGIRNNGSGDVTYDIAENRVQLAITTFSQPPGIYLDANGGGAINGRIHDNRLVGVSGQAMRGIALYPGGASTTVIYANQISGNLGSGIGISPGNSNAAHSFAVVGNAIVCNPGGFPYGISPTRPFGGSLDVQIFNNTVTGCNGSGVTIGNAGNTSTLSGRLTNNLFAYNGAGIVLGSLGANVSNDHNLLFGNNTNNYTPGTGTVTTDPLLRRGKDDARLTAGSPAIDAADSSALRNLLVADAIGEIDADGSRRFKGVGSLADIGAFEFGDTPLVQRKVSGASSYVALDGTALDNNAGALPQLTPTRMAESYQAASNSHYMALVYTAPTWYAQSEGSVLLTANSAFNVLAPAPGDGVLLHTTTSGNVTNGVSFISNSYLNNKSNLIVLAAHRRGTAFDQPYAVAYFISQWGLWMGNVGNPFPTGLDFHVYAQDPSLNALRWVAPETGNTTFTVLDQLVANGEPCAQIYVQQAFAHANPHPIELRYVSALKRWRIENIDNALLPGGSDFMVVVDEAATVACRWDHLFHDGFDVRD